MKIKHIVLTRWFWDNFNAEFSMLDDGVISLRLKYIVNNLVPSLNNQTNLDFEWILVVSQNHTDN